MKKMIVFVMLLFVVAEAGFSYDVNPYMWYKKGNKGFYSYAYDGRFYAFGDYSGMPQQIFSPHTDYSKFYVGIVESNKSDVLYFSLVEQLKDYSVPRTAVPDKIRTAYGDYFSAYINTSDYTYAAPYENGRTEYNPHDWLITFKDDKGNIVAQDMLTGEVSDYFYERSFGDDNYFSTVEFTVANSIRNDYGYNYLLGISDISINAVPEPSSLLALAFGGVGTAMLVLRRRK
ncbi:MAG: PEP-CTERM sorting domain-containing protein [Abditibacteriota bacterium]|nr:PEP-CTERM sorting domain-containing protein [Abditibacteriota bacterium]